ncbi:50S ribosomal protein L24e [Candidatus Woesearchaeota archaeon]|nr:50S ribosomal protein L24e [Candidatus Woesearchaeota archaeon]
MARCIFCRTNIEKGTGKIFVMKDGRTIDFCSNKCEKNMIKLGKKNTELKWITKKSEKEKKEELIEELEESSKEEEKPKPKGKEK